MIKISVGAKLTLYRVKNYILNEATPVGFVCISPVVLPVGESR